MKIHLTNYCGSFYVFNQTTRELNGEPIPKGDCHIEPLEKWEAAQLFGGG